MIHSVLVYWFGILANVSFSIGLYNYTDIVDTAFMHVLMQTFFKLRSMIGDTVELQSYKFNFDDLDLHKKIVFGFVSDFHIVL